ncbi:MAG: GNAT family N-acetyltransferase [Rhodospirillales bacterium]|nr:GNAT family N-acetyltransferase [Rhodospirillales bacterium]
MPDFRLTNGQIASLDSPIRAALTSHHAPLSQGGRHVRRYVPEIAPFAALLDESAQAFEELRAMATASPVAVLNPAGRQPSPVEGLAVGFTAEVLQMVAIGDVPPAPSSPFLTLGAADAPEMVELAALTKPGPFLARTHEFGRYIGIREGGRLAAMTGERMRFDGFTEISAVCVHPDHRGRRHAQVLFAETMRWIAARGDRIFLHVYSDNAGAIALYERYGFAVRTALNVTLLKAADGGGAATWTGRG